MFHNFFCSGFIFSKDEKELELKYRLFNSLLLFNMVIVFIAAWIRLYQGETYQFIIDIIYSLLALFTLFLVRKKREYFNILVKFVMIFSYFIVTATFSLDPSSVAGISWFIILIMVTIFLTEKKFTLFILVLSILTIAFILYQQKENGYTLASLFYGLIPLILAFIFIYFDEQRNIKNQQQLKLLNENLQELVQIEVEKNKKNEALLIKQAQAAAMGEMIDAIAHQWKQPLNVIQISVQTLSLQQEMGTTLTLKETLEVEKKVNEQIKHLVETIDEFRSFFRPNKNLMQEIKLKELIESTLILMKSSIISNNLKIKTIGDDDIKVMCLPNEFKHIIINMINNSIDSFIDNKINDRIITFEISQTQENVTLQIIDNAGGIPKTIIDNIFEAHISTKVHTGQGSGIGLYLTKQIIEKLNATIKASNIENGASFTITIPKKENS